MGLVQSCTGQSGQLGANNPLLEQYYRPGDYPDAASTSLGSSILVEARHSKDPSLASRSIELLNEYGDIKNMPPNMAHCYMPQAGDRRSLGASIGDRQSLGASIGSSMLGSSQFGSSVGASSLGIYSFGGSSSLFSETLGSIAELQKKKKKKKKNAFRKLLSFRKKKKVSKIILLYFITCPVSMFMFLFLALQKD